MGETISRTTCPSSRRKDGLSSTHWSIGTRERNTWRAAQPVPILFFRQNRPFEREGRDGSRDDSQFIAHSRNSSRSKVKQDSGWSRKTRGRASRRGSSFVRRGNGPRRTSYHRSRLAQPASRRRERQNRPPADIYHSRRNRRASPTEPLPFWTPSSPPAHERIRPDCVDPHPTENNGTSIASFALRRTSSRRNIHHRPKSLSRRFSICRGQRWLTPDLLFTRSLE